MIEAIANLLKVLNSETEPGQISLALCLAMIAGFTPVLCPHNLLVLLLVLGVAVFWIEQTRVLLVALNDAVLAVISWLPSPMPSSPLNQRIREPTPISGPSNR